MSDPSIQCPKCGAAIPLAETLTGPLREELKREFLGPIEKREADLSARTKKVEESEKRLQSREQAVEEQIARGVKQHEAELLAKAEKKARDEFAQALADREAENAEQRKKLDEFRRQELELRRKAKELEDAKAEIELQTARRMDEERDTIRREAEYKALETTRLKMTEKDKLNDDLRRQLDDMKRRMDQGSQQLQGEVLELTLEQMLRENFPRDRIEEVAKGRRGADILQRVINHRGEMCGTIVWESKQTKNWSPSWLQKLKDDQREVKGDLAVLVSSALPPEVRSFQYVDGVFVSSFETAMPLAGALRMTLEQIQMTRQAAEGKNRKVDLLYEYLAGIEFRNRIEGIADAFRELRRELDKEKRAYEQIWARRQKQIEIAMRSASGLYGDLQAITGASMPELEHFSLALDEPEAAGQ
jgi:hypothetical protein